MTLRRTTLALALLVGGCAPRPDPSTAPRRDSNLITREQLAQRDFANAYDAVRALKGQWLIERNLDDISNAPPVLQVYVNDVHMGGVSALRDVPATTVTYIRYIDAIQALARWGRGHERGVIFVSTRPGDLPDEPSGAPSQAQSDEQQVRRARAAFNDAIARHDVPAILTFLEDSVHVSSSSGDFRASAQAMGDAFADRFAQYKDALYVRTPERLEVSANRSYTAETGHWVGSWTTPTGAFRTGGRYAAYWRKSEGRWLVHAELYVPLYCEGPGCR